MWTRGRFNDEYVPGLFALAIDTFINKRADSMYKACLLYTSPSPRDRS